MMLSILFTSLISISALAYAQVWRGKIILFPCHCQSANENIAGVNIAGQLRYTQTYMSKLILKGFDFGCDTSGNCPLSSIDPPLSSCDGADGISQMQHFVSIGLNTFRLPVAWQYLVNDDLGGDLDETNFGKYDELVQGCIDTGAFCIVDVHNYARWNGQIVGQSDGAVTNDHLESLWKQLATKYQHEYRVVFGVMNEV